MDIIALIAIVIIGMMVVTLPIYIAAKVVSKKASFGRALVAALLGPFVFFVVFAVIGTLTLLTFAVLLPLAFVIALIVLIYFYAEIFGTSFLGGLLISIIAVIISFIILVILSTLSFFAVSFPGGRHFGLGLITAQLQVHLPFF